MVDFELAREHMEIVGSDGQHVGVLSRIGATELELAAGDPRKARPRVPNHVIESIDVVIRLNTPARDAIRRWLKRDISAADNAAPTS
jgi:hypothetical protein